MKRLNFILLLLLSFTLVAQEEFSKIINVDTNEFSGGFSINYSMLNNSLVIQSGNSCENLVCFGLSGVDLNGNLIWHKIFQDSNEDIGFDDRSGSMLITNEGNVVLAGGIDTTGNTIQNYFLMLTDSEGDSLWLKTYPNVGPDLAKVLAQMPDKGYLIGGTNGYFGERDIRLIRTDSLGEVVWEKEYADYLFVSDVHSIKIDTGGDILLSGQTVNFGTEDGNAYLSKISDSDNGEILWDVFWGTEVNECPLYIDILENEEAYVGAWCVDNDPNIDSDVTNKIRKIDYDLNTIWEYDIEPINGIWRYLYNIKALEDGSVLVLGRLRDESFFNQMDDNYNKLMWEMSWMFKLSPDGELEWERVFFDSDYVHFFTSYDMLQTPDGSIYTVGQTTDSLVVDNGDGTFEFLYDQNIWLVRFDENGCFNGDCGPDNGGYWDLSGKISTSVSKPSSRLGGLSVYPNPSSGLFRLDLRAILSTNLSYQVYDVSGRLVEEKSIAGNSALVEIDLSVYEQGVYFLQLYEDGVLLGVERLVVF